MAEDCVGRFKSPAKAPAHLCGRISSFAQGFLLGTDAELGGFVYLFIFQNKGLEFISVKDIEFKIFCGESRASPGRTGHW